MYRRKLYSEISAKLIAIENCKQSKNVEWKAKHEFDLFEIEREFLPSGSGIDSGCKINLEKSSRNKIQIDFGYHCMDQNGFYCGWIHYKLIITPDLASDFNLRIIGKDFNGVKEYLFELFDHILNQEIGIDKDGIHKIKEI